MFKYSVEIKSDLGLTVKLIGIYDSIEEANLEAKRVAISRSLNMVYGNGPYVEVEVIRV